MEQVHIVITIDITHELNTQTINSITWSHWEEDIAVHGLISKQDAEDTNEVHMERMNAEDDTLFSLPPATSFSVWVTVAGHDKGFVCTVQAASWKVSHDNFHVCWY